MAPVFWVALGPLGLPTVGFLRASDLTARQGATFMDLRAGRFAGDEWLLYLLHTIRLRDLPSVHRAGGVTRAP